MAILDFQWALVAEPPRTCSDSSDESYTVQSLHAVVHQQLVYDTVLLVDSFLKCIREGSSQWRRDVIGSLQGTNHVSSPLTASFANTF